MTTLGFVLLGGGIGLAAGLSPGPVLTLVLAETVRGGWLRGTAVAAGPLLADGPIVVLALLVLGQLPAGVVQFLTVVGGLFLLLLAGATFLTSWQPRPAGDRSLSARGGLLKGLLARGLSPHPYLFWFLVGAPLLLQASRFSWLHALTFLLGYYTTIIGSNVVLALALHQWTGHLSDRGYRWLLVLSAAVLAAYGLGLLVHGLEPTF